MLYHLGMKFLGRPVGQGFYKCLLVDAAGKD